MKSCTMKIGTTRTMQQGVRIRKNRYTIRAVAMLLLLLFAGCRFFGMVLALAGESPSEPQADSAFAGSSSCRGCHEKFYELWATSHHGLAMQPYTDAFARASLMVQDDEIEAGLSSYQAFTG